MLFLSLSLHEKGVCIFVDGLDEIDPRDGPFDLLSLVKRISSLPKSKGLKVCVSSRPETSFKLGLEPYPKLRLQDLTKHDVEVYGKDFLQTKCSFNLSGIDESQFLEEIVSKANGVFLWVSLALRSLQRGITNGDDPTKLMERLRALPSELGKLYDEMFKRLGDDQDLYAKEAAVLFNIFIVFSENRSSGRLYGRWNLFQYAAAFDPAFRNMLLKQKCPVSPTILNKLFLEVDRKLTSRCAGILEVVSHLAGRENIAEILSMNKIRPWDPIGIEFLHRSAKDFLLSMENKLLDQDPTSAAVRKFQVLQAIVLEDIYTREEYLPDRNIAMDFMINSEPTLPNEQELDILNLTQELYQRNGWCEFYEVAARYGLHQPLTPLLESISGDMGIRNYLLLCAVSSYTQRTNTTVSYLLEMGPYSNDFVALIPASLENGGYMYFTMPLLGYFFGAAYSGVHQQYALVEKMVHSFVESGADLEQKFLCCDFGCSYSLTVETTYETRPNYVANRLGSDGFDVIVEINCVELILREFVNAFTGPERSAVVERLGLDMERAHRKVLLHFYAGTIYGADDEDSDTLNKILGWQRKRTFDGDQVDSDEDDSDDAELKRGRAEQFEKVREVLKGKEVDDATTWLADRGYMLPEKNDIVGISGKASIHEMAGIYQRLSKKFGQGRSK